MAGLSFAGPALSPATPPLPALAGAAAAAVWSGAFDDSGGIAQQYRLDLAWPSGWTARIALSDDRPLRWLIPSPPDLPVPPPKAAFSLGAVFRTPAGRGRAVAGPLELGALAAALVSGRSGTLRPLADRRPGLPGLDTDAGAAAGARSGWALAAGDPASADGPAAAVWSDAVAAGAAAAWRRAIPGGAVWTAEAIAVSRLLKSVSSDRWFAPGLWPERSVRAAAAELVVRGRLAGGALALSVADNAASAAAPPVWRLELAAAGHGGGAAWEAAGAWTGAPPDDPGRVDFKLVRTARLAAVWESVWLLSGQAGWPDGSASLAWRLARAKVRDQGWGLAGFTFGMDVGAAATGPGPNGTIPAFRLGGGGLKTAAVFAGGVWSVGPRADLAWSGDGSATAVAAGLEVSAAPGPWRFGLDLAATAAAAGIGLRFRFGGDLTPERGGGAGGRIGLRYDLEIGQEKEAEWSAELTWKLCVGDE